MLKLNIKLKGDDAIIMKEHEKKYIVAHEFETENCLHTIRQPKRKPSENELKDHYIKIAKIIFT